MDQSDKPMFERLAAIVEDYNRSGQGRAVLQKYNANSKNAFILCIVTNLMNRMHKKIRQAFALAIDVDQYCSVIRNSRDAPANTTPYLQPIPY